MRNKSGRFVKGYSGNAGGRPKDEHNIAALARSWKLLRRWWTLCAMLETIECVALLLRLCLIEGLGNQKSRYRILMLISGMR